MLIDYFSEINDHGTVVPVKDLAAMTWEANAVFGARNIFNFNNRTGSGTTTGTTDNFNLSGTGTYRSAEFTMPVEPNTSYKIKFNVEVTSGLCFANAYDVTNSVTLATGTKVTQNTNGYTFEFSTGLTTETIRIGVFCTDGTSATGNIDVKNFEIVLASDTYDGYTSPTMTNRKLTENFPINYSTSGLNYTKCSYVAGGYAKFGKLVIVNIRVLTDNSGEQFSISGLPSYTQKTLNGKNIVPVNALNMTDDSPTNYYSAIAEDGTLNVYAPIVANKEYAMTAMYLCN